MPNELATALDHSTAALRDQQQALQRLQRTLMNVYRGFRDFRYLLNRSTRSMRTQDEVMQSLNRTVKAVDQSFRKLRQSMAAEQKKQEEAKKKPEKVPLSKIKAKDPQTLKLDKVRSDQEALLDFVAGTRKLKDQTELMKLSGEAAVIKQIQIELRDAARALRKEARKLEADPSKIMEKERLEGRAFELMRLSRSDSVGELKEKFDVRGRHRALQENKRAQERLALEKHISNTIAEGLLQAVTLAKSWREAIKGVGIQLLKILAQEGMRLWVQPLISQGVRFLLGGFGRAAGGPVRAGQTYLVGERGPELFRPAGSGRIVPNHQLGAMTGRPLMAAAGPSFQFNFHIESTDGPGVQAALAQARPLLMQDAAEMAKSVVGANLSRPSPLRGLARR